MFNLTKRGKKNMSSLETLKMVRDLTEAGNSTMDIIKLQKGLIDLLAKRISILEDVVFKDVRKNDN
jgi:hypothetical protein|tara:strand:- start:291 stop:488 length:198 start_codon:yes stop_codon:yes gene_type:complete